MALQTINIDDRSFDQLLEELKKHIPVSQWTDHNPSDPGIMLLELFAWLGEMTLYRMNRVPESHKNKFLKLIIDPPEPVTVDVELLIKISKNREEDLFIPPGKRFATDFKNGKRYIFETFQELKILKPTGEEKSGPEDFIERNAVVKARNFKEIKDEILGRTSGTPNQTFPLKQAPVLLDFVYSSDAYKPNPAVYVDGVEWVLKQFLLTEDSQVKEGELNHFMVDGFENIVRFGDNNYGSIPPADLPITCTYRVMEGPEALIKAGELKDAEDPGDIEDTRQLKHILDDIAGLEPGETISIKGNHDAMSDLYFVEKKEEQAAKGLENFKKPYRLITAEDFEDALMTDFNQLQDLTRKNPFNDLPDIVKNYDINTLQELAGEDYFHPDNLPKSLYKICRAAALMNRKYIESSKRLVQRTGHVTILVIPEFNEAELKSKDYIEVDKKLENKIMRFLDQRRLITTQIHIMPAKLKKVDIKIKIVIFKERSSHEMEETIRRQVTDFMDLLHGGFHQIGWPPGKNLYKSHLYRLVEGIDGVDYVKTLTFSPCQEENCIEIGENELPLLQNLDIYLERG